MRPHITDSFHAARQISDHFEQFVVKGSSGVANLREIGRVLKQYLNEKLP